MVYQVLNNNDSKADFGKRFQAFRESLKLTKAELAESLGFNSPETITLFEAGVSYPSPQTLIDLANTFPVDIHELLTGEVAPLVKTEVEALRELKHRCRLSLNEIVSLITRFSTLKRHLQSTQKELGRTIKLNSRKDTKHESTGKKQDTDAVTTATEG